MIGRFFRSSGSDDPPTEADYATIELDPGETLDDRFGPPDHPNGFKIRPDEDHDGIDAGVRMLQGLHDARSQRGRNVSIPFTFEIRRLNGRVSFAITPGDASKRDALLTQLETAYPGLEVEEERVSTLHSPDENISESDMEGQVSQTQYVAAGTLKLTDDAVRPIRHLDIEGFDQDPYASVIQAMSPGEGPRASSTSADMLIQIVMRPCFPGWTDGPGRSEPSITEVADELTSEKTEKRDGEWFPWVSYDVPVEPSKKEKKAAKIVRDLANEDGWSLNIRIATASEDPQEARDRTHTVGRMFRAYYESSTGQGFEPVPATRKTIGGVLDDIVHRRFDDEGIWVSRHELAGLAHLPNDTVPISSIERAYGSVKRGVPVGTPRFEYRNYGLDAAESPPAKKQVTMCSVGDPMAPIWYGWGTKHGVEAGVFADLMDTHQFVGGATGKGKTTLLKNFWRQVIARGHGALFIDPKGRDAGEFVDLVPDDREDDLIYVEIGGDREREVGFNFLEPSGDVEHGTAQYVDAVEACAEDLAAVLAEAGDADGDTGWGTRMDRITKNVVRGMARAPDPLTILDMHYALGSQDQRQRYAQMLADEQISWIEDYARNQLAEMDDDVLEPLSGRLNQLVENDIVRNMISVRESTVSIEEIVRDGKIVVVRNLTTSSTAKRLITTALIRRLWVAVREQTYSSTTADPPAFFPIIDEFDSVVSERSQIHSILSEARAFGLCLTLACQNPSNQLPKRINAAIQNQCETFLTFDPGGSSDAKLIADQHSRDVDYQELLDLPKYRIMLRTHTDVGEKTPSYPVQTFPPLEEQAKEAGLDNRVRARSEVERDALIQQSLEQYGSPRRSDDEIKRESRFYNGPIDSKDTEINLNDHRPFYKYVYDSQIHHSDDPINPQPIGQDETEAALRDALASIGDKAPDQVTESQIHSIIDQLRRRHLVQTDDYRYFVNPDGQSFLDQDSPEKADPRAGHQPHRRGVEHAYHWTVHALPDCEVSIPDQGGEESDLHIEDPATFQGTALAVDKQRQQFRSDNPIRATLTDGNDVLGEFEHTTKDKQDSLIDKVTRAYDADKACLFYCWSSNAAQTIHRQLGKPDSRQRLPDDARWNTLVLPTGEGTPELYLGPNAEPSTILLSEVSPQAVDDATTQSDSTSPLSGIDVSDI